MMKKLQNLFMTCVKKLKGKLESKTQMMPSVTVSIQKREDTGTFSRLIINSLNYKCVCNTLKGTRCLNNAEFVFGTSDLGYCKRHAEVKALKELTK